MRQEGNLTPTAFAKKLREYATPPTRQSYSATQIRDELIRVSKWFSKDGTFYDKHGNVYSISGKEISHASNRSVNHMKGRIDPKSGAAFTLEQQKKIADVQPHNILHNSAANKENINGLSLPEGKTSVKQCQVHELKTMLLARSGNVTASNGAALAKKELQKLSRAFLNLESENPLHTQHFNRSRMGNGVFSNVDTSERRSTRQILESLANCSEYNASTKKLFNDALQLYNDGRVQEDLNEMVLHAPDLQQSFIQEAFIHVGMDVNQKSIQDGCKKVLDMDEDNAQLSINGLASRYRFLVQAPATIHIASDHRACTLVDATRVPPESEEAAGGGNIAAPMHGQLLAIEVEAGQAVTKGQRLAVLEAMKMQHEIAAPADGTVVDIGAEAGKQIGAGDLIMTLELEE